MRPLVIVPTYNERENIPVVLERLLAHDGVRVLVVDDGSPDGTADVAEALAAAHRSRVQVLRRTGPRGLGRSYIDGMLFALRTDATHVCQMDADLSHNPTDIPRLLAATADAEVGVYGEAKQDGESIFVGIILGSGIFVAPAGARVWDLKGLTVYPGFIDAHADLGMDAYAFYMMVNARSADRLPQTSSIALPGLDAQVLLMALDIAGVGCSVGSACSSGSSGCSRNQAATAAAADAGFCRGMASDASDGSTRAPNWRTREAARRAGAHSVWDTVV